MDALSAAQPDMLHHAFLRGALQQTHFENDELIFKETAADWSDKCTATNCQIQLKLSDSAIWYEGGGHGGVNQYGPHSTRLVILGLYSSSFLS